MFKIIPDTVNGQTLRFLSRHDSARDAALMMTEFDISSIVVLEGEALVGLVTEHDLARRVVAAGLDADNTSLEQIMTANPATIAPDASSLEALEKMRIGKFRHLPIVEAGAVIGMVTMRDLRHSIARDAREVVAEPAINRWWRLLRG